MNYKKEQLGSYDIHVIETSKFNTISVVINLRSEINKEDLVYRNLLTSLLIKSTKNYQKNRLLAIKAEELYNIKVSFVNERIGNNIQTSMKISFLNPKLTNEKMLKESFKFIFEILFNPNVNENGFDSKYFKLVHQVCSSETKNLKEDMKVYSIVKLLENMGKGTPIEYNAFDKMDILDKINEKNLYDYYLDMIKTSCIDILVLGEVNSQKVIDIIKDMCPINTIKKKKKDIIITHKKLRSRVKNISEEDDINQAKLTVGFKTNDISKKERLYVMPIFNEIYGGSSDAKLFKSIREKHSLAYYIYSQPKTLDNIMYAYCGIDGKETSKVIKLIKKHLVEMKEGQFTKEDISKAKINYKKSINNILESPFAIINCFYSNKILDSDLLEERIKKIDEVEYEDIINVANKVHSDTTFVVRGKKNERV